MPTLQRFNLMPIFKQRSCGLAPLIMLASIPPIFASPSDQMICRSVFLEFDLEAPLPITDNLTPTEKIIFENVLVAILRAWLPGNYSALVSRA